MDESIFFYYFVVLKQKLGLTKTLTGKKTKPNKDIRPVEVFMCSVVLRSGFPDGIRWLDKCMN